MNAMIGNSLLLGSGGGYKISRSVRLRASASAYFNRTPTTPTSNKIFTYSMWVKRGLLGSAQTFVSGTRPGNFDRITFSTTDTVYIQFNNGTTNIAYLETTQVFRDPSSWYHFVFAFDTTQATASNRLKMYVNGTQITAFSTATYPAQNTISYLNTNAVAVNIGRLVTNIAFLDGYLTEINFIDGYPTVGGTTYNAATWAALNVATLFGSYNADTGVWQPIKYNGTYGNNGFYLNFSDNSAATAAAIGKDYSGNGNNWTPNNISVTAGATYDSMLDVPTPYADGGNGRGNYCTMNYIQAATSTTTFSNANLKVTSVSLVAVQGTLAFKGAFYFECTVDVVATNFRVGVSGANVYFSNGDIQIGGVSVGTFATYTTGNVIGVACDTNALTISFYKNNVLIYTGAIAGPIPVGRIPSWSSDATGSATFNFGQRPFTYTPPSGYKATNTFNTESPPIPNGEQFFNIALYTGTGSTFNVPHGVTGGAPDFVWLKSRSVAANNGLFDSVRGYAKALYSNSTSAEVVTAGVGNVTSTVLSIGGDGAFNTAAATYVAWSWRANGAAVTNTSGSITSQVSASPTAGISVLTYTGTGANATVGHGLGDTPSLIIVKQRTTASTTNWAVWHTSLAATEYLLLNSNAAKVTGATTYWNSTLPTSSVFSIGTAADVNTNTGTYVAYVFSSINGFSVFSSYTGNGSGDGTFVYTGFRPRYILFKSTSVVGANWAAIDTSRDPYNYAQNYLIPNATNAETVTSGLALDIVSNGFKLRGAQGTVNAASATYIFAAFAENPFKYALAR